MIINDDAYMVECIRQQSGLSETEINIVYDIVKQVVDQDEWNKKEGKLIKKQ